MGGFFLCLCILANSILRQDFVYLTQTFRYSSQDAYHLLDAIGEAGRRMHLSILLVDAAMIIAYTNLVIGINYRLSCKITDNCHLITALTFSILPLSLIQTLEIIATAVLISNASRQYTNLAKLASTLTTYKFYLTPICYGLPIVLVGVMIGKKLIKPSHNKESQNSE